MNKTGALSAVIAGVPWNVFATLTFRRVVGESYAMRHAGDFMKRCARLCRVSPEKFIWLIRYEQGERTGRPHVHALIAVPPSSLSNFTLIPGRKKSGTSHLGEACRDE